MLLQSVQSQHTTCSRQCRQPITRTEPNRPTPNQLRRQEIFIHPRFLNSRPHPQDSFPRPRAMVERSLAENLCQRSGNPGKHGKSCRFEEAGSLVCGAVRTFQVLVSDGEKRDLRNVRDGPEKRRKCGVPIMHGKRLPVREIGRFSERVADLNHRTDSKVDDYLDFGLMNLSFAFSF